MGETIDLVYFYDVIVIGAGISGVNTGYRLQTQHPDRSYVILEGRANMGGTWDLFKYPGIRSDSDLQSYGFPWRPWSKDNPLATGESILTYLKESAELYGIDKKMKFRHKVKKLCWLSRQQNWTLTVESDDGEKTFCSPIVVLGTGYYDYDKPLEATIPGIENFKGQVIHPQFWPKDLDYADKKVAVIGSGATAITLIPALAEKAEKVVMVQRSPSYVVALPNRIGKPGWFMSLLPMWMRHTINRYRFIIRGLLARRRFSTNIDQMKDFLMKITIAQLPKHIPYDPHFKPRYNPWDQRMCLCPDGDFFKALRNGKADVATGIIKTVSETSIQLESGQLIDADIIVTATGLRMKYGGNADFYVDGEKIIFGEKFFWRGVMIQDLPNLMIVRGYAKASWTLGADATAFFVCRLISHLKKNKLTCGVPRIANPDAVKPRGATTSGVMGLTSTYIKAALHRVPKTSEMAPWADRKGYLYDLWDAKYSSLDEGMQFTKAVA
jgi:cation diffusion facilitator CzcD-associated flavoprotein CzcO